MYVATRDSATAGFVAFVLLSVNFVCPFPVSEAAAEAAVAHASEGVTQESRTDNRLQQRGESIMRA